MNVSSRTRARVCVLQSTSCKRRHSPRGEPPRCCPMRQPDPAIERQLRQCTLSLASRIAPASVAPRRPPGQQSQQLPHVSPPPVPSMSALPDCRSTTAMWPCMAAHWHGGTISAPALTPAPAPATNKRRPSASSPPSARAQRLPGRASPPGLQRRLQPIAHPRHRQVHVAPPSTSRHRPRRATIHVGPPSYQPGMNAAHERRAIVDDTHPSHSTRHLHT
jgi:hypothetical protein